MPESLTKHFKDGKRLLDELPSVQVHSPLVTCIMGLNPGSYTLTGTNTYLVGSGEERILIDTGEGKPEYVTLLKQSMTKLNCKKIKLIIATHWHYDHIGGIPSILNDIDKDIPVYKFSPEVEEDRVKATGAYDKFPANKYKNISDKQIFKCEGATLKAIYTPGHANDHVCLFLEEENSLFSGDNILGIGTGVFTDLTAYLNSLDVMKSLRPKQLYPGHGPLVEDGISKCEEYIAHRLKRVNQVTEYFKQHDDVTSQEVTKSIYQELPEHLFFPANSNTEHVLRHLMKKGVLREEKGKWMKVKKKSQI